MSIKITIPNSSSDVLTFGSGNTPTAAQIAGIDSGSSNGQLALYTTASGTSTERMRIDSSGNVVIGDTSTSGKFKVAVADDASFQTAGNFTNNINADFKIRVKSSVTDLGPSTSTPLTFSIGGSERMRIDSSGNLLVGTTTATGQLTVKATAVIAPASFQVFNDGNTGISFRNSAGTQAGSVTVNTSTVAYNTSSDYRLKEDIKPMTGALDRVASLKPVTYTWKTDGSAGQGFIAHELQAVVPECVTGEKDAVDAEGNPQYQGIDTSFLVATLTAAIQEQQAIITSLTDRITALENK